MQPVAPTADGSLADPLAERLSRGKGVPAAIIRAVARTDRAPCRRSYRTVNNTKPPPRRSTGSASRRWRDSGLKPSEAVRVRNTASPENR